MAGSVAEKASDGFRRVERTTIADQIRIQLIESVRSRRFAPGERIPPARQLCDEFGVARTTLLEAIQQLLSLRMLERRGNRLHVVEHFGVVEPADEGKQKQLQDLMEARRIIEISLTELAACRATDQQRAELMGLASEFNTEIDAAEFRELNHRFHAAIGECSGNPLLAELYDRVLQAVFESSAFASLMHGDLEPDEVEEIIQQVADGHHQIACAIRDGDPVVASEAAATHVADVESQVFEKLV